MADDENLESKPDYNEFCEKLKQSNPDKSMFEGPKYDFESNKDLNKDLHLLPPVHPKKDPEYPVPKPDGMLFGQDNPFFKEERYRQKNIPPNVKYDLIGPFGSEPNPDIDPYPLHTSKGKNTDLPDFGGNFPNFNPGNRGGFGNFPKF